jgi:cytochrome b subunit of formate dehydrogenase
MRPMSHWVEHIPDYGDGTSVHARALYESKRRVRPEDVQLTTEELERIHAPKIREWNRGTKQALFWLLFWIVVIISLLGFFMWYP